MKLTPEEKAQRDLQKRLYGEVKYKRLPPSTEAVVQTMNGKRRLVRIENPTSLAALTFGKRVFVKSKDNVFYEVTSEPFYSLPAGVSNAKD